MSSEEAQKETIFPPQAGIVSSQILIMITVGGCWLHWMYAISVWAWIAFSIRFEPLVY